MADYIIDGAILTDIADAIRAKTGGTEPIAPEAMAQGVSSGYEKGYSDGHDVATTIIERTIQSYTDHKATNIGGRVFFGCSLRSVEFSVATNIEDYAFAYCRSLKTANFPKVKAISGYGLGSCTSLEKIELPSATSIKASAFINSTNLATLILSGGAVCELAATSAFSGTAIGKGSGYIYVPDNLVEQYKIAANWSTYAAQIKPISELEGDA